MGDLLILPEEYKYRLVFPSDKSLLFKKQNEHVHSYNG